MGKYLFIMVLVKVLTDFTTYGQYTENNASEDGIGRNFFNWIGLGTGPDTDPYLAQTNNQCLKGDLAECFKSRALTSFDDLFDEPSYQLNEHVRVLKMPQSQLRQLSQEHFEYSDAPRADEPEWDQLLKFGTRKIEKFLKSNALEVEFNNEITEHGRYSPRFVDEIADEIDLIEDKKDSLFKRKQLKKLFIPLLIILKIFKLKLLLFLPLILGLASFKKFLGFVAILIPGLIGFFKLCRVQNNYGNYGNSQYPQIGFNQHDFREPSPNFVNNYGHSNYETPNNYPHHSPYEGWSQYRSKTSDITAQSSTETKKKSILPSN